MPVRQLSQPSVSASAISSRQTVMSTTRVSVTGGESASGAVGSSTTISISESDMRDSLSGFGWIALTGIKIDCHHPPTGLASGEPHDRLQRMIQYSVSPDVIAKARNTGCPA